MPRLLISRPGQPVRAIALAGDVSIGRHPTNVVSLPDATVSGSHARIVVDERGSFVEDLGSVNGTIVDGQRVPSHQRQPLSGGERLSIGPFQLAYASETMLDRRAPIAEPAPAPSNARRRVPPVERTLRIVALFAVIAALASIVVRQVV
jgi:pSer/pThr/pTyr-binding forkhead associated (FHA) protein